MAASASARRYASAVFSVATQEGDYDVWLNALQELARILQMPSAHTIFASPSVSSEQKRAALDRIFPNIPPTVRNLFHLLIERDRLNETAGLAETLAELINRQRGIITADVTTAIPLDSDLERIIAQRLATYLNHDPSKINLRGHVDPAIIGGVVARVGDRLIDDSVRGRIERLRRSLAGTR